LSERKAGDVVHLTLFRRDELVEVAVPLGAAPCDAVRIVPIARPTALQLRIAKDIGLQ
jgi:predicted metalloprotease with PDZ domain